LALSLAMRQAGIVVLYGIAWLIHTVAMSMIRRVRSKQVSK
jgi:hypothetical protein